MPGRRNDGLTPGEWLVVAAYADTELPLASVAADLGVTLAAAQSRVCTAYEKLGVGSRDELRRVLCEFAPVGGGV